MNLHTRLAVAGGTVVVGAMILVSAVLYPAVRANLRGQTDSSLILAAEQAPEVAAAIKTKYLRTGVEPDFPLGPLGIGNTQLQIVPDPVRVGPSTQFIDITARDVAVAERTAGPYFQNAVYQGVAYRVYTAPFPGVTGTLVRTAIPQSDQAPTLQQLAWLLMVSTVAAALLAALASRLAARRVLRPVHQLTETVELIRTTGDLSIPIAVDSHDEIGRLGSAFAATTAALNESVGAQRRLVADASHELRIPQLPRRLGQRAVLLPPREDRPQHLLPRRRRIGRHQTRLRPGDRLLQPLRRHRQVHADGP